MSAISLEWPSRPLKHVWSYLVVLERRHDASVVEQLACEAQHLLCVRTGRVSCLTFCEGSWTLYSFTRRVTWPS